MNLTREDVKRLGQRGEQPKKEPGDVLAVFVAGKLVNTLNATGWYWRKRQRWAKEWKERTAQALLETEWSSAISLNPYPPVVPKRVHFTLHVARLMDSDAWPGCVKPVRDALMPYVIHDDGPTSGHVFTYSQVKDGRRGVTVRARLRSVETP